MSCSHSAGIGAQERALRQLNIPYEVVNTCDCDANAVLSYVAMRWDLEKEMEIFKFPSQDKMIEELQAKNLGYDFQKEKHSITRRTPINKLKQYYIADKLCANLGDISKVEKLPYADIVTYSFPCTDLSVAGKCEGMVNKCDGCGYSWPIDFSNAEESLVCPNCGETVLSSTRSGLLGQVQRLLDIAKNNNTLPKYLLLENVKNLIGKKFRPQFDVWVNWLDSIGYNTYYKVLNAKHFGIPQNRERIFAISIRKDIDTNGFTFPEPIPPTTRLKDILEHNVDEKYYLPNDRIEKILNSSFMQEKKRIQTTDVCDTPLARDWKDPKCVPVEEDEIKVVGNYMPSNHDASGVVDVDGIAPTVKENHGTVTAIAEPQIIQKFGDRGTSQYSIRDYAHTIPANPMSDRGQMVVEPQVEPFIVASRGRNPENPSDRTTGAPTEQRLEPNFSGCTNTLTSVQKDNYVCEPQVLRAERTEYGKAIRNQYESEEIDEKISNMREMKPRTDGVSNTITTLLKDNYVAEPIIYDDYNSRISQDQDAITTLTTNCGASAERNGVKIIEPVIVEDFYQSREPRVYAEVAPTLRSERTGLKVADEVEYPCSTRGKQVASAIRASIYKQGDRNLEENVTNGLGYEGVIEPKLDFVGGIGDKDWAKDGKQLSRNYPQGSRVYSSDGIASALTAQGVGGSGGFSGLYTVKEEHPKIRWRIRKLTSLECWRLMGFTDEDHNRAAKYTSASARYKMAGNSIVVECLIAIFSSLFLEDGYKAGIWNKQHIEGCGNRTIPLYDKKMSLREKILW